MIQALKDKSVRIKSAQASASCASKKEVESEKKRKEAMEMVKKVQQLLKEADKEGKEAAIAREAATKKVSSEETKIVQKTIKRAAEENVRQSKKIKEF